MDSKEIVMQSKPGSALLLTLKSAVTLDRLCCERDGCLSDKSMVLIKSKWIKLNLENNVTFKISN